MIVMGRFQAAPAATTSGNLVDLAATPRGSQMVAPSYEADPDLSRIVPTASNGVTAVPLVVAAAGQRVWPVALVVSNGSGTRRTMRLLSNATPILQLPIPADGGVVLDPWLLAAIRTNAAEALQFDLTDAGVADVTVSGAAIQR